MNDSFNLIQGAPNEPGEAPLSEPDQKSTVLGENVGLSVFSALGIIVILLVSWLWLAPLSESVADALERTWFGSYVAGFFLLVATCRVTATPSGVIEFVNPFIVRRLPIERIAEVGTDHGLVIRLHGGREVRSAVNSRSLAGEIRGYPEAKETRRRIEYHLRYGVRAGAKASSEPRTHFRWRGVAAGLGLAGFNLGVSAVVSMFA